MKQLIFACTAWLLIHTLPPVKAQQGKPVKNTTDLYMKGAYTMTRQVVNLDGRDSVMGNQQFKLFTDKYVMYAHRRPQDSLAEFGIGTYKIENGKVIENMFYVNGKPQNSRYELAISKDVDGFKQVINFPPNEQWQKIRLTEEYKNIGKRDRTPLDGAWKQTRHVDVDKDGKQTITENPVQYKVYESGAVMWANTSKNEKGELVSLYGYGMFEMTTPTEVTETMVSSTFSTALVGKPVKLKIKLTGKNNYEQTIVWPDGSKMIETYTRLK
jgi:hypothetical protein